MSRNQRFDPSINYYAVLDVPLNATREEITRTYRGLMRVTHPDNFTEPMARMKAEERCKLINAAYSVLSRPDSRKEYDRVMRHQLMADMVMQRYTGRQSARQAPLERQRRQPTQKTLQARKLAYRSAVMQLMMITAAVAVGLIVVVVAGALAFNGLQTLF